MRRDLELERKIKELYDQGVITSLGIAKKLSRRQCVIYTAMKRLGLTVKKRLKYNIDIDFFKNIDTEEKAWVLGLWYADGNVTKTKLQIEIMDLEVLEKVKKILKYTGPIYKIKRKITEASPYGHVQTFKLNFNRVNMIADIINKGCIPNKSLILKFPTINQVPENLIHHFIRGWFDGDGSVNCENKRTRWRIGFVGTREIIDGILKNCNIDGFYKHVRKNTYMYNIGKQSEVRKFIEYIYKDATVYMDRKYIKSLHALKYIYESEKRRGIK